MRPQPGNPARTLGTAVKQHARESPEVAGSQQAPAGRQEYRLPGGDKRAKIGRSTAVFAGETPITIENPARGGERDRVCNPRAECRALGQQIPPTVLAGSERFGRRRCASCGSGSSPPRAADRSGPLRGWSSPPPTGIRELQASFRGKDQSVVAGNYGLRHVGEWRSGRPLGRDCRSSGRNEQMAAQGTDGQRRSSVPLGSVRSPAESGERGRIRLAESRRQEGSRSWPPWHRRRRAGAPRRQVCCRTPSETRPYLHRIPHRGVVGEH